MNTILSLVTKLLAFKIAGLIFLFNFGINSETLMNFCENNTESIMCPTFKLPKGFTKCKGDVRQFPLSETEKKSIVNVINEIRNTVAKGNMWLKMHGKNVTLPQASSMTVMQWDDDLAVAASKKVNTCHARNYPSESIRFGIHQAMGIHPHLNETGEEHMKDIFLRYFRYDGKWFNKSLLENYPTYQRYDFFSVLAHDSSLFIGCAMIEQTHGSYWKIRQNGYQAFKLLLACYLAPSEKEKNNTLYKQGAPCTACPFRNKGYKCDDFYKSLCARPNWTLSDSRTQDANFLTGFDKETTPTSTTTTSTTTTSATTTSTTTTSTTTTSITTTSTTPTSTMTTSTTTTSTTPTSTTTSSTTTTSTTTTSTTTIPNSSPEIQSEVPVPTFGDDYYSDEDELTTTKSGQSGGPDGTSRSPMLVPSRYLPIIICVTFLSLNIFME